MRIKPENQKRIVSRVMVELEKSLHKAIDEGRTGDLSVFEMIMVSADTLEKLYKQKKQEKKEASIATVIEFKRK